MITEDIINTIISNAENLEAKTDIFNLSYSVAFELDQIRNEILDNARKAKLWDMIEQTDPDATIPIIDNIDLRRQIKSMQEGLQAHREALEKSNTLYIILKRDFEDLAKEDNEIRQKAISDIQELRTQLAELDFKKDNLVNSNIELKLKLETKIRTIESLYTRMKLAEKRLDRINYMTLHAGCRLDGCAYCKVQGLLREKYD